MKSTPEPKGPPFQLTMLDAESLRLLNERLLLRPDDANELLPEYLPEIIDCLIDDVENAVDVPETLVSRLLAQQSLQQVLDYIAPIDFDLGLKHPEFRKVLLEQLLKVSSDNVADPDVRTVLQQAVDLWLDKSFTEITLLLELCKQLAAMHQLAPFVHFETMHAGSAEIKARLFALNSLLVENKDQDKIPAGCFLWDFDLTQDDPLFMASLAEYYTALLLDNPTPEMTSTLQKPLLQGAEIYARSNATLINAYLEDMLVAIAQANPQLFLDINTTLPLISSENTALLARLNPTFSAEHFPHLIAALTLSHDTAPQFIQLVKSAPSFKLLNLSLPTLLTLAKDTTLPVLIAITADRDNARWFAENYRPALERVLEPATLPEYVNMQRHLRANLSHAGISLATVAVESAAAA